jgi:hypothetical protein
MIGKVYSLTLINSGEIFYIGSTIDKLQKRWQQHASKAKANITELAKTVLKNINNISIGAIEEIEIGDIPDINKLRCAEKKWIMIMLARGHRLTNKCSRGESKPAPIAIRLGKMKPYLLQEAHEKDISLNQLIYNVIDKHIQESRGIVIKFKRVRKIEL